MLLNKMPFHMCTSDAEEIQRSDKGGLAASYVNLSDAEAIRIVRRHFGCHSSVARFATKKNDTFRFGCSSGGQFVLKVANPA